MPPVFGISKDQAFRRWRETSAMTPVYPAGVLRSGFGFGRDRGRRFRDASPVLLLRPVGAVVMGDIEGEKAREEVGELAQRETDLDAGDAGHRADFDVPVVDGVLLPAAVPE